jgi:hypothetical protein
MKEFDEQNIDFDDVADGCLPKTIASSLVAKKVKHGQRLLGRFTGSRFLGVGLHGCAFSAGKPPAGRVLISQILRILREVTERK